MCSYTYNGCYMKAVWRDCVIAESDQTVMIEGKHYFPADSLNERFIEPSETTTYCSWKGEASYYNLIVKGNKSIDAAWSYSCPKSDAENIKGHVAFWMGVNIIQN